MNLLHPERHLEYFDASKWLPGAVLLGCVITLIIFLNSALSDARDLAEEQSVRVTLRTMRTGMQVAKHEAITYQRGETAEFWEGSNPMRWLETAPQSYYGHCPSVVLATLPDSTWCFDAQRGELVFRPRNPQALESVGKAGQPCQLLVWRVMRREGNVGDSTYHGFDGFDIVDVGMCRYKQ